MRLERNAVWRDERWRAAAWQLVVAALMIALLYWLGSRTLADLRGRGLAPGLGFLENPAGFAISEGIAFEASKDSYWRALYAGLVNTVRVAGLGIILSTLLGFLIAMGRLSGNPLLTRLCSAYIEVFRNTPLLVQLIFWFQGVVLRLPEFKESIALGGSAGIDEQATVFLSRRGLAVPKLLQTDAAAVWGYTVGLGLIVAILAFGYRRRLQDRTGLAGRPWFYALSALFISAILALLLSGQMPFTAELPRMERFDYANGSVLSPEFSALLIGLSTYTAAFIAELIRSGIQAVPVGQFEAAGALGLSTVQSTRFVILPQALRVIVPPLTSQYLNLTKNSTLALFIGFQDLYNVSQTISNNTGQAVAMIVLIMAAYLSLSLITSLLMNLFNRRIRLVER